MRLFLSAFLASLVLAPVPAAAKEVAAFTIDIKLKGAGITAVDMTIRCDHDQPFVLEFSIPADASRTYTVPVPADREISCRLDTRPLPGYQLKFLGDGGSTFDPDSPGCRFTGIRRGHANFCQVQIEDQVTSLTVFKRWIGTSAREDDVAVYLDCGRGLRFDALSINAGQPDTWRLEVHEAEGYTCSVSEEDGDAWIPDTSDCENLLILPGAEEECTVVNTKVVKMIEMLNRYGLVIMILVFMVVGGFAARKFIP